VIKSVKKLELKTFYQTQTTHTTPPHHHNCFTALFHDHPGEPVPEDNFWTLWSKGRLTEAETVTIQLGATPSELTSAHVHHHPFSTGRMPLLQPNQQCQSTGGNIDCTQGAEITPSLPGRYGMAPSAAA